MTAEEWALRCDLAALYRVVAHFGMTDFIYTHISARVPADTPQFLINNYGVLFQEMRASDLVKIDVDGRVLDPEPPKRRVNTGGFVIHSAIHMNRPDIQCVAHVHTLAGIAVASREGGLLPLSQHAMKFHGRLGYHDFEGVALEIGERERLSRDLGPHMAMLLRNHGLLACGRSIPEAFNTLYHLERACQAQVQAQMGGGPLHLPPPEVVERTAAQLSDDDPRSAKLHQISWEAAVRLIDGGPRDFRT
jgi:ribulose-5-phosphate 4-epimerase/fuculose-1-phosphate aldolase